MAQFQKCFGDLPEDVVVLSEVVSFDSNGFAEVSDEVAEVLAQVPGYKEVVEEEAAPLELKEQIEPEKAPKDENASAPLSEESSEVPKKTPQRRTAASR